MSVEVFERRRVPVDLKRGDWVAVLRTTQGPYDSFSTWHKGFGKIRRVYKYTGRISVLLNGRVVLINTREEGWTIEKVDRPPWQGEAS